MIAIAESTNVKHWANLVRAEYREMPGLSLTKPQMARLWGFNADLCDVLVDSLLQSQVLRRTREGNYVAFQLAR
jgi:hypothetical protein